MNIQSSALQPQSSPTSERSSQACKERVKHEWRYPTFEKPVLVHESLCSVPLPKLRVNTLLIRPYTPAGFTASGIYVEKGTKYPKIWGHLLAMHPDLELYTRPYTLVPGDLVLYHRFSTEELFTVPAQEPLYEGEKLEVHLIHIDAVQCKFTERLVDMRI